MCTVSQLIAHFDNHEDTRLEIDGMTVDVNYARLAGRELVLGYQLFDREYEARVAPWGLDNVRIGRAMSLQDTNGDELLLACSGVKTLVDQN